MQSNWLFYLKDGWRYYRPALEKIWFWVFLFAFISAVGEEFFVRAYQLHPTDQMRLLSGLGQTLFTMFVQVNMVFIVPVALWNLRQNPTKPVRVIELARTKFLSLFIEQLRATARVILWGLLLIVPGIYKAIQYNLVTLSVFFDPDSEKEDHDALIRSTHFTKGLILFIFLLYVPETLMALRSGYLVDLFPTSFQALVRFPIHVFALLISCFSYSVTMSIYLDRAKELEK